MSKFTVVLLYPPYLTDAYGTDVYVGHTETANYREGLHLPV